MPGAAFRGLTNDELAAVKPRCSSLTLSPAEILFREDEQRDTFYIVVQGQIEIIKSLGAPGERVLAIRGDPEYFGEMSLFSVDHLRTTSARGLTVVNLLSSALFAYFPEIDKSFFHIHGN